MSSRYGRWCFIIMQTTENISSSSISSEIITPRVLNFLSFLFWNRQRVKYKIFNEINVWRNFIFWKFWDELSKWNKNSTNEMFWRRDENRKEVNFHNNCADGEPLEDLFSEFLNIATRYSCNYYNLSILISLLVSLWRATLRIIGFLFYLIKCILPSNC